MSEALKKKRKKRNSTGLTNQLHGKPSSLNDGGREERYGNSPAERERDYIDGLLGLAHARALLRNGMVHLLPSYLLVNERALFKTTTKKRGKGKKKKNRV